MSLWLIQVRVRAGEGTKRAGNSEITEQAGAGLPARAREGPEADLRDMLSARDELMNRCCTRPHLLHAHRAVMSSLWQCFWPLLACLGACHADALCMSEVHQAALCAHVQKRRLYASHVMLMIS